MRSCRSTVATSRGLKPESGTGSNRPYRVIVGQNYEDLATITSGTRHIQQYGTADDNAYTEQDCANCDSRQSLVVAIDTHNGTRWLRCVACRTGMVRYGNLATHPAARPLRVPAGVPEDVVRAWNEARDCLSVGANTAAVMICRKVLFHLAVEHGLPPKNDRDRAPTFIECVDHLQDEGIFTARMRSWVDRIKDIGNEANHDLTAISAEAATDVATFTQQLLVLAFELDALNNAANPGQVDKQTHAR